MTAEAVSGAAEAAASEPVESPAEAASAPAASTAPAGVEDADTGLGIGIDIGGTGIKVGLVDLRRGKLAIKRIRVATPKPATPEAVTGAVASAVGALLAAAAESGLLPDGDDLSSAPFGCAFPGVVKDHRVTFAPNLDRSWIGEDLGALVAEATGREPFILNDADAAGYAEMTFGAGRKCRKGTVIVTTLGTGIGSALFSRARLVPFTELGHLEIDGAEAEHRAAESVRVREELSFEEWAARLTRYYRELEKLFVPDLFIVGGGVSKRADEFLHLIDVETPIVAASLRNSAGIVGAAAFAARGGKPKVRKRLR